MKSLFFYTGKYEILRFPGGENSCLICADGRVLLSEGPDGSQHKQRIGVLSDSNQLEFTCSHCNRTTTISEPAHTPGCTSPANR